MPIGLSIRAYARRRGVSHSAVQKAISSGRIRAAVLADGSLDPIQADLAWAANTDPTKPRNSVTGNPRRRRDPAAPPQPMTGPGDQGDRYSHNRGVRELYVAGLKRLEYLQRSRSLVRADEVHDEVFGLLRTLRDSLSSLPDRLSEVLTPELDANARREILRREIDECLGRLERAAASRSGNPEAPAIAELA